MPGSRPRRRSASAQDHAGLAAATRPDARSRNVRAPATPEVHTPVAELTAAIAPAVLHAVFQRAPAAGPRRWHRRSRAGGRPAPGIASGWREPGGPLAVVGLDRAAAHEAGRGTAPPGLAARFGRSRPDGQGVGGADRPASRSARARRRRPQLDGPRRGTETLDRRPRRQRRPLAAVSRLAARSAPRPARRRDAQGAEARFPGARSRRGRRSGSRCADRTKRRSGPS